MKKKAIVTAILGIALVLGITACGKKEAAPAAAESAPAAAKADPRVVGRWNLYEERDADGTVIELPPFLKIGMEFNADGTTILPVQNGDDRLLTFEVEGDILTIYDEDGDVEAGEVYRIDGDKLVREDSWGNVMLFKKE
jgi:hypothetical protein